MSEDLVNRLKFSFPGNAELYSLPLVLQESLKIIFKYFKNSASNKLCLVFPSKEYTAQWLSIPLSFSQIESDYEKYKNEIQESYTNYKRGDRLLLNNSAVVSWIGKSSSGFWFNHKEYKGIDKMAVDLKNVSHLQPSLNSRAAISSHDRVVAALSNKESVPVDKLLAIKTNGNRSFIKNTVCLISKFKRFDESIENLAIGNFKIDEYLAIGRIDEDGAVDSGCPLVIGNNLLNLAMHITVSDCIQTIIIDGFSMILDRATDFSDIDAKGIKTILITDLSEIDCFENIGKYGFDFYNFTKTNIKLAEVSVVKSPFHRFDLRQQKYISFQIETETCQYDKIDYLASIIQGIENKESNIELTTIKIQLVQILNIIAKITYEPTNDELIDLVLKVKTIQDLYDRSKAWLEDAQEKIVESIELLNTILELLKSSPISKCLKFFELLKNNKYDYIICANESDRKILKHHLHRILPSYKTNIISLAEVDSNIVSDQTSSAIIVGWLKSVNMNFIISSFLFSKLTILFYPFEYSYFESLQRRNSRYSTSIFPTINEEGARLSSEEGRTVRGFSGFYEYKRDLASERKGNFDIFEFELKLENLQFARYFAKDGKVESYRAKRIDFVKDYFIYSAETHKYLVINDLIVGKGKKSVLYSRKLEFLKVEDVIAWINTDRDILVELVEKNTNTKELALVKYWTQLWRSLLIEYYKSIGCDFKKLIIELNGVECKRHPATIKSWITDDSRIGPDDDSDLISIALLTNSELLNDNISLVREAISKMTGWRMRAADFITEKIKEKILELDPSTILDKKFRIEGLGSVICLKIVSISSAWQNIDARFVNRLIQNEGI